MQKTLPFQLRRLSKFLLCAILVANFTLPAQAHSGSGPFCSEVLSSAKNRLFEELKKTFNVKPGGKLGWNAARIAGTPFRLVFYPVAGPFKAGSKTYSHFKSKKSAKSAWKVFFQVLREDYVLIAGFLLLIQLNDDEIIMSYVFDESSPEFDQGDPDGLLVVVNTMQSSDLGHRFVKSLVDTKYGHFKNRKYIEVSSYEDFLSQVEAIAATHGPITRLDLVGHGNEGAIYFGSQNMTAFDFAKTRMLEGVFAKDAQVRMSTCFSGRGKNGDELLNSMAIRLLDEGGTMYAATTAYYPTDQAPFMLGLGNSSRNVFRFVAKGPAALDVLLERHLGISHFGLSSYSGQPKTERTEPKVKRRDYEPRAKWLKNALEPAWLLPRTLRAIDQTLPNAK